MQLMQFARLDTGGHRALQRVVGAARREVFQGAMNILDASVSELSDPEVS